MTTTTLKEYERLRAWASARKFNDKCDDIQKKITDIIFDRLLTNWGWRGEREVEKEPLEGVLIQD